MQTTRASIMDAMTTILRALHTPRTEGTLWLFDASVTSVKGFLDIPGMFGLHLGRRAGAVIVNLIEGPHSGKVDLLSTDEIHELLCGPNRFMVRWEPFNVPLRLIMTPGVGLRIEVETLEEVEFRWLHQMIVLHYVNRASQQTAQDVLLGVRVLGSKYYREPVSPAAGIVLHDVPDYLFLSTHLWESRVGDWSKCAVLEFARMSLVVQEPSLQQRLGLG